MNKIIIIAIVLILIIFATIFIFVKSNSQRIATYDLTVEREPLSMIAVNKGKAEEDKMGNQDYIENQVVAVADSKREAKKIAKAIGGTLLSYDNQVAVIQIGITVEEMMQKLEEDSSLPKVYPNYQNYQIYSN